MQNAAQAGCHRSLCKGVPFLNLKRIPLLFFVVLLCAAGLFVVFRMSGNEQGSGAATSGVVRINEVMTSNKGAVPDENGNLPYEPFTAVNQSVAAAASARSSKRFTLLDFTSHLNLSSRIVYVI